MYPSKFVVYLLLLVQQLLARNFSKAEEEFEDLEPSKDNYARRSVRNVEMIDALQLQSETVQLNKKKVHRSRNSNSNFNTSVSNINDDDDFRFLVTGGYRPENNALVKYVVSIRTVNERKFFGDNHFCGGAIISSKSILTAAHCLYIGGQKLKANRIKIVAGTPRRLMQTKNTQEILVESIKPHPKYSQTHLTNDIGIIKLKEPIRINADFATIVPINDRDPKAGQLCTVVGWGTVIQYGPTPDEVVNGDVTINTNTYCSNINGFKKGMLCASNANDYEVDSCQGDSGGPLICDNKVVGIVSFGNGCGEPDSAGVYTDVYYFRDWIGRNSVCRLTINYPCYKLLLISLVVLH
ncbi:putative trypsin-6 [Drosophila innubila]|uniref:putative trypsin-6 n=1 Tax=Drosophila innubila TaxID=198719 RepID=UPI00148E75A5|nr:putative trypsin-6 [Drosophila innubila]